MMFTIWRKILLVLADRPAPAQTPTANQQMLNNIFRINEQVVNLLVELEPHAGAEQAAYEIRRLRAFREVAIELAAWLYADEDDPLAGSVPERFSAWLMAKILAESLTADSATLEGYYVLARDLRKNQVDMPKWLF